MIISRNDAGQNAHFKTIYMILAGAWAGEVFNLPSRCDSTPRSPKTIVHTIFLVKYTSTYGIFSALPSTKCTCTYRIIINYVMFSMIIGIVLDK